jgi:hypothetical protein
MVWKDILGFIKDPAAPLPSGAPPIPTAPGGADHVKKGHATKGQMQAAAGA